MPTVMNAHTIAAKTDAIWLREESVISISFLSHRTIPAMRELLHGVCHFHKNVYLHIDIAGLTFLGILKKFMCWENMPTVGNSVRTFMRLTALP